MLLSEAQSKKAKPQTTSSKKLNSQDTETILIIAFLSMILAIFAVGIFVMNERTEKRLNNQQ
jgi:hypothetical protein